MSTISLIVGEQVPLIPHEHQILIFRHYSSRLVIYMAPGLVKCVLQTVQTCCQLDANPNPAVAGPGYARSVRVRLGHGIHLCRSLLATVVVPHYSIHLTWAFVCNIPDA